MNKKILLFLLPLFFIVPFKVNAAANLITGGMNYFIYNIDENSPTKNGTQPFAITGSTTVYPFSSYTNEYFAFGYKTIQFTTNAPSGSKSALGYTITTTFQVLFDGLQNNMGNTSYTGWVKFNDGMVVNEVSSVELIALTSGSATFKITTTAQLTNTTNLNNMTISLSAANTLGFSGYGEVFTVQLVLRDVVVQYAENENSAILNSLNRNQQQTNKKLDEVKEEQKKQSEQQKETNDTLKDDKVDEANSKASDFFNNFTDQDHGGISGIVKAPLVAFNAMLTDTCTPLTATYEGKEISLQCGTEFWGQLGALKTFINLTYGGILCYLIAVKLFKLVNNLKDPNNDKVEVMDL